MIIKLLVGKGWTIAFLFSILGSGFLFSTKEVGIEEKDAIQLLKEERDDKLYLGRCQKCQATTQVFECPKNGLHRGCRSCVRLWLEKKFRKDIMFKPCCRICKASLEDLLCDLVEEVKREVIGRQPSLAGDLMLVKMSKIMLRNN
jgi:hypothetical protein